jgi:hypothetical protein
MCAVNVSALSIGAGSRWILAMTLNGPWHPSADRGSRFTKLGPDPTSRKQDQSSVPGVQAASRAYSAGG